MNRTAIQVVVLVAACGLVIAAVVGAAESWSTAAIVVLVVGALVAFVLVLESHRIGGLGISPEGGFDLSLLHDLKQDPDESHFASAAQTYAFVHNMLGNDAAAMATKIELQDKLVTLARQNAFATRVQAEDVERAITQGTQAERVLAFGVLQGDTTLATRELLEQGISRSRSANEQYQALVATKLALAGLTEDDREAVLDAIRHAPHLDRGTDRRALAEAILGEPLS